MKPYCGRGNKGPTPETAERMAAIRALRDAGLTWAQIGERFGVSRQRVHQMATRNEDGSAYLNEAKVRLQRARYHRLHPNARHYR